ncbi:hypothetical protein SanaruYs_29460 [Chryseotalea sanaruensis]|uniref:DUF3592 domain-containing protein n=1 Tax=Chryseotalea sanaruensis TaxID=2482724 RepID=A0A401UCS9_9BACT|nr:hypothetical protein [Chryseotalea sanaruensis]GCC52708.1 hypothetical protein SanaruYs_29460 [Chryseotalea sanaruensis]
MRQFLPILSFYGALSLLLLSLVLLSWLIIPDNRFDQNESEEREKRYTNKRAFVLNFKTPIHERPIAVLALVGNKDSLAFEEVILGKHFYKLATGDSVTILYNESDKGLYSDTDRNESENFRPIISMGNFIFSAIGFLLLGLLITLIWKGYFTISPLMILPMAFGLVPIYMGGLTYAEMYYNEHVLNVELATAKVHFIEEHESWIDGRKEYYYTNYISYKMKNGNSFFTIVRGYHNVNDSIQVAVSEKGRQVFTAKEFNPNYWWAYAPITVGSIFWLLPFFVQLYGVIRYGNVNL